MTAQDALTEIEAVAAGRIDRDVCALPPVKWKTKEYYTWGCLKSRCLNPNDRSYHRYGGRGITVHADWIKSFDAFLEHVGPAPTPKHTIDRIDNARGYEPGNVRWATQTEQQRNRSSNRVLTLNGVSRLLVEWAEDLGVSGAVISERLKNGWSLERALTQPKRPQHLVTYAGRTQNLNRWGKEVGITPQVISSRLRSGWPVGRALGLERAPPAVADVLAEICEVASNKRDNDMTCLSKLTKIEELSAFAGELGPAIYRASRSTPDATKAMKAVAALFANTSERAA
jgi:hypothetical protein